jgi:hypothetical protein
MRQQALRTDDRLGVWGKKRGTRGSGRSRSRLRVMLFYHQEYDFGDARLNTLHSVNAPFWSHQHLRDGSELYYSPYFGKIQSDPLPDMKGGWLCEKMGLGKTMETIALINLSLEKDKAQAAAMPMLYQPALLDPEELDEHMARIPRDREGRYYAHTTLVMCPVNLIPQWILECQTVSTRPLKILEYHSTTARTPLSEILQYDIVITVRGHSAARLQALASFPVELRSTSAPRPSTPPDMCSAASSSPGRP